MAKLNKQEINAIASKVLRIITANAEEARNEAIKNYEPSEEYNELKIKLERCVEINKTKRALNKEEEVLSSDVNRLSGSGSWFYTSSLENEEHVRRILAKRITQEVKLKEIPSIEELKEDITIAAIDENFDADSFINNLVEKFK